MTLSQRLVAGLHRWGGLMAGPLLLALGLSGSVLVFRSELQDLERLVAATGERDAVVVVDPATGTALVAPDAGSGRRIRHLVRRLHAGDFAGWPAQIAYALLGLTLPVLVVTGYLISARRWPQGA